MIVNSDYCRCCGSEDLFSGFFGPDDLAVTGHEPDARWTTFCNRCGEEQ